MWKVPAPIQERKRRGGVTTYPAFRYAVKRIHIARSNGRKTERQQKATSITDIGMMKIHKGGGGGMNTVLLRRELYRLPSVRVYDLPWS